MMNIELIKRAVTLFPKADYLDPAAVRHDRRQWLKAVEFLRSAPGGSRWILDRPVAKQ
jgi:hypothetical protein